MGGLRLESTYEVGEFRPIIDHVDAGQINELPVASRSALCSLDIALSARDVSAFRTRVSSVGGWWFSSIEGQGLVHFRGRAERAVSNYVLLVVSLSGDNHSFGRLASWPRPGEMVLVPWEAPTSIISSGEFRYLIAHIPKASFEACLADEGDKSMPYGRPVSVLLGVGAVLSAAVRKLAAEAARRKSRPGLEMVLSELAHLILRTFQVGDGLSSGSGEPSDRIQRIINHLETHLADENLSSEQVARACGLSTRQLFRSFAAEGQNFAQTLRLMRVERARELLIMRPNLPISEVALSSGFSRAGHFSRVFRTVVGSTPMDYRRRQLAYRAAPSGDHDRPPS